MFISKQHSQFPPIIWSVGNQFSKLIDFRSKPVTLQCSLRSMLSLTVEIAILLIQVIAYQYPSAIQINWLKVGDNKRGSHARTTTYTNSIWIDWTEPLKNQLPKTENAHAQHSNCWATGCLSTFRTFQPVFVSSIRNREISDNIFVYTRRYHSRIPLLAKYLPGLRASHSSLLRWRRINWQKPFSMLSLCVLHSDRKSEKERYEWATWLTESLSI